MYENPGDELYFGQVYRQILQEAWLPQGSEEWMRLGKSRRGWRPTQRGLGAQSPSVSQATVRRCFSLCADNWRYLPDKYPPDHPCADIPGKEWWWQEHQARGVMCSYYDLYMRYCIFFCLKITCPPEDIVCWAWDPDSTKETIHGYWAGIYVLGGFPPFYWSLDGQNMRLKALVTSIRDNGITSLEDKCGIAHITVTDFCGRTVEGIVVTPDVPWPYLEPTWSLSNPEEIEPNTPEVIFIEHGVPPFEWEIIGEDFTLDYVGKGDRNNTLYAGPSACGSAKITVIDCLGTQVTGSVRSTAGQWVQKSEGACGLSGEGICISNCDGLTPIYELIAGYQRQLQTSYCPVVFGACWDECHEIACGMQVTLEVFCTQVREEFCTFDPSCSTCIDTDHEFCKCVGPPAHPHRTWCVSDLKYFEWEC